MNIIYIIIGLIIFTLIFSFIWRVTKAVFRLAMVVIFVILIVSVISVMMSDGSQINTVSQIPFSDVVNETIVSVKNNSTEFFKNNSYLNNSSNGT